ncbi:hypothetical protein CWI75_12120 [Kineobactrum sediminis]|uniref:UrcA family protein n=1 Tax=Kineobactrum sediminis TaxID=1905677 RepID=A0A2N5Y266_9GAMM|nr:UrcA family protein [Kineobactrum sediminis]PLW82490.1 hypothetical protein CWI75_12120 [Kineobactrum sediminis]
MKTLQRKRGCTNSLPGWVALILALAMPLTAGQALAEATREQSTIVSWEDLNLARPAGLNQLYLRLEQASRAVCAPREDSRNPPMHRDYQGCQARAMDAAVNDVGHQGLRDLHASRNGKPGLQKEQIANR